DAVTDVLVNAADEVFIERDGALVRTDTRFERSDEITELAHRIAAGVGRELTLERPFVDARMRDGSRANAVIAPIGGPSISIRKFRRMSLPLAGRAPSWTAAGAISEGAARLLADAVAAPPTSLIDGAMTTAHAGSASGAMVRLDLLLARAGDSSPGAIERHVRSAFDLVVHLARRGRARLVDEIAAIDDGVLRSLYEQPNATVGVLPTKLRRRLG